MDKKDTVIVPCASVTYFPESSKNQAPATIDKCSYCKQEIWMTQKKKSLTEAYQGVCIICYECLYVKSLTDEKMRNIITTAQIIEL